MKKDGNVMKTFNARNLWLLKNGLVMPMMLKGILYMKRLR